MQASAPGVCASFSRHPFCAECQCKFLWKSSRRASVPCKFLGVSSLCTYLCANCPLRNAGEKTPSKSGSFKLQYAGLLEAKISKLTLHNCQHQSPAPRRIWSNHSSMAQESGVVTTGHAARHPICKPRHWTASSTRFRVRRCFALTRGQKSGQRRTDPRCLAKGAAFSCSRHLQHLQWIIKQSSPKMGLCPKNYGVNASRN